MVPIEPWQNSTSFMVQQPSVRQKLTILEDALKNKNGPKNQDNLKILTTRKGNQNPRYCDPFLGAKAPLGLAHDRPSQSQSQSPPKSFEIVRSCYIRLR